MATATLPGIYAQSYIFVFGPEVERPEDKYGDTRPGNAAAATFACGVCTSQRRE